MTRKDDAEDAKVEALRGVAVEGDQVWVKVGGLAPTPAQGASASGQPKATPMSFLIEMSLHEFTDLGMLSVTAAPLIVHSARR